MGEREQDAALIAAGAGEIARRVRDGELTARSATEAALRRIAELDGQVRAFTRVLADEALAEADRRDAQREAGERLPLHGVPVAIKDDTDVAGVVTSWGTGRRGPAASADAAIVARLRAAGAVVVGKTAIPELTTSGFTETPAWGATRNPWDLDRTPGGSSGGSAAAVAAGIVPVATATDGLGSTRIPAGYCGLVGLKGTRGRIPVTPDEGRWSGLIVQGAFTRTVADQAAVLDAVEGDGAPYGAALAAGPGRLRIAVSTRAPLGAPPRAVDPEVEALLDRTAERLRDAGHEVVRRDPAYGSAFLHAVARYVHGIGRDRDRYVPGATLSRRARGFVRLGRTIPDAAIAALERRAERDLAPLLALWDEVDVLLTPVTRDPAFPVGRFDGRGALATTLPNAATAPYPGAFNVTGQPGLSVPAGRTSSGLPVGVQLVGRHDADPALLALGAQLEAVTGWPGWELPLG